MRPYICVKDLKPGNQFIDSRDGHCECVSVEKLPTGDYRVLYKRKWSNEHRYMTVAQNTVVQEVSK